MAVRRDPAFRTEIDQARDFEIQLTLRAEHETLRGPHDIRTPVDFSVYLADRFYLEGPGMQA